MRLTPVTIYAGGVDWYELVGLGFAIGLAMYGAIQLAGSAVRRARGKFPWL